MAGMIKFICILLVASVFVAEATIDCKTVVSYINPCVSYLTNKGPIGQCCNGVKNLNSTANTTPSRQAACNCLKTVAKSYKTLDPKKASGLPKQCGISLPFEISASIDCSKVT